MERLRRVHRAETLPIGWFTKIDHIFQYRGVALASIPTTQLMQDRVLGAAVLIWLGALFFCVSFAALSSYAGCRTLRSSVKAIWWSHSPLCMYAWLVQRPGTGYSQF